MKKEEQWLLKEKHQGEKTKAFFADLERLNSGEPLAYIIGHVPFLGCTIYLDSHPIIPRPESEYWVEKAIVEIRAAAASSPRILDLCAGSGAIGVAVARQVPEAEVTFAEICAAHLPTIGKNLKENAITCTTYKVWQSDLFSGLGGQFDYILSNPPYIDPALDRTEASVKAHEPLVALYGGTDGLELIERIIKEAPRFLAPEGVVYLEHEPEQAAAIIMLAHDKFAVEVKLDQFEVARYSILTLKKPEDVAK